ncbi:MAG: ACT domain-containing protein, partial [Nitrosomonas sp. PRO5]|nr:ACT domain-containing protein [Nitrosomonas sp. PRO5]
KPGVLADITRILADNHISINAMIQKEHADKEDKVNIIMLLHKTREKNVNTAIEKIQNLPAMTDKIIRIRLEELGS